jgi:cytochrome P450 family 6
MVFTVLVAILLILGFVFSKKRFKFWMSKGFKQLEPTFFIGNAWPLISQQKSIGVFFHDLYDKHKNLRIFGIYFFYRPTLVITDPKLVQDIMVRDFKTFGDRPAPVDEEGDPLSGKFAIKIFKIR